MEAAGVGFVIIQMRGTAKIRMDPHDDILKDHRPGGEGLQADHLLVRHAEAAAVLRGKVDVPLGSQDSFVDLDLTAGAG